MAACWSWITSPVAKLCVYGVLCAFVAEVFFPVLTLYSPRSIVWGLFFSSSLSSCYAVFFFKNPCISLLIVLCMIVYVTNKPTLTLTLTLCLGPALLQGIRILNHIDIWLILAESEQMAVQHRDVVLAHTKELGLRLNARKVCFFQYR